MDTKLNLVLLTFVVIILNQCVALNILAIFPSPSRSHTILGHNLFREVALRGHNVTFVSDIPMENPPKTYKQVLISGLKEIQERHFDEMVGGSKFNPLRFLTLFLQFSTDMTEQTLQHKNFQELLAKKDKYDVIVIETFMNEAQFALGHYFGSPVIGFSPGGASMLSNDFTGNPETPSYIPQGLLPYSQEMTLGQRTLNTILYMLLAVLRHGFHFPSQEQLMHKYFPDAPDIYSVMNNVSLVFLNSHSSISPIQPLMPNTVEIGGFAIPKVKTLPKDLKDFLDSATEGVVYMSMGSNIRSKDLKPENKQAFLNTFKKLKQKVLWKWDEDTIEGLSKNVKLGKWFPQTDILAHPNVKLFITHGGLGSLTESIYRGVPMVGMAMFAEQPMNVRRMINLGLGLSLDKDNLTEEAVSFAINEVLNNPKYQETIKLRSALFKDQPQPPIDRAIYWMEFVSRHGGARHLSPVSLKLRWYQYILLDVFAIIGLVLISVLSLFGFITYKICKKLFGKNKAKHEKKD